jgi:hypothetical protein
MPMTEETAAPQMSPQALIVYKAISDQFDFLKKQQWATTNYVVLIYAAIAWCGQHIEQSPVLLCVLMIVAISAGGVAIWLLIQFQRDLAEVRERSDRANDAYFSAQERQALGLKPYLHPFWRGWQVLTALILVCVVGAILVFIVLNWPLLSSSIP